MTKNIFAHFFRDTVSHDINTGAPPGLTIWGSNIGCARSFNTVRRNPDR